MRWDCGFEVSCRLKSLSDMFYHIRWLHCEHALVFLSNLISLEPV